MSINIEEPQPIDAEKAETTAIEADSATAQREHDELEAAKKHKNSMRAIAEEMECASREHEELKKRAEDLKERAKKAKDKMDLLADSLKALALGDVQTEIGEITDGGIEGQEAIKWTPEELEKRKESGDAIELQPGMIAWADLEVAALDRLTDTNKPQQLKPVVLFGKPYVCTGIDKRIVTLIPALDTVAWGELYPALVPMDRPNDDQLEELAAHGKLAGIPVKCEMSKSKKGKPVYQLHHLAGDAQALLVKMPEDAKRKAEPEVLTIPEQEDPPRDYGLIANRIIAEVELYRDEPYAVAALVRSLGLTETLIVAAVKQSDRLSFQVMEDGDAETPAAWIVNVNH